MYQEKHFLFEKNERKPLSALVEADLELKRKNIKNPPSSLNGVNLDKIKKRKGKENMTGAPNSLKSKEKSKWSNFNAQELYFEKVSLATVSVTSYFVTSLTGITSLDLHVTVDFCVWVLRGLLCLLLRRS